MSLLGIAILLAVAATVYSLLSGVTTMATHNDVGHRDGERWMWQRVLFQAIALALVVFAYLTA